MLKIKLRSISARLFLWIFAVSSILLIGSGFLLFYEVKTVIISAVDGALHSDIQIFSGLLHEENGRLEFELSEVVGGDYTIPLSGHYYKILINDKLLAVSPSLVDDNFNLLPGKLNFSDNKKHFKIYDSLGPDKEPLRVMQQEVKITGMTVNIIAARSLYEGLAMLERFKVFLFVGIFISIFLIAATGLLITKQSLTPLKVFSSQINRITYKTITERIDPGKESRELNDLALSFNFMLDRLQKSFEAEKRIVSDASHELKTPVSVIKSQCDVLLQKERNVKEYLEALKTIRTTTIHMGELIQNMLSLAQLDSGLLAKTEFKMTDIGECISDAVKLVSILAENKQIEIKTFIKDELKIMADKDRLTEAFLNIIENAVKYNKDSGRVEILASQDNNSVRIFIKDTGLGIKESDIEYVFERFYRSDQSRRAASGSGLGLSISKAIIEAHNGEIKLESEYGKGTMVIIQLPLKNKKE